MNRSRSALVTLSQHSVAYGVGVLGSQLIVYVLLPFLTRYMPREEYGVVSVITAIYSFLNMLTNAGLPSAAFRYFNGTEDERDRQLTLGSTQLLFFLFAAIPAIGILLFPKPISMLFFESGRYALALQMLAGYLIVDSMNTYGGIILRIETRALVSSLHSIFLIAAKTGLALLFVIGYRMGVAGYWLGHFLGESLGFLVMIWLVRKKISFYTTWNRVKALTQFGLPMIPATLSITALRVADRYIITALAGLEQVAIYDVGYKIGSMILLLVAPFRIAWNPFAFSIANKPEAPKIFKDVLTYLTAGCAFLILGVFAFRAELIKVLAPASYGDAEIVVGWVAASQLFYAVYFVFQIGPMLGKRTSELAWIAVASSGVNILLNFILIPFVGIVGAAISTLIGYAMLSILAYMIGRQSFDLQIDWGRMGKLLTASGLVALTVPVIENLSASLWIDMILKTLVLACYPILLLGLRFVKPRQVKELVELGRTITSKKLSRKDDQIDTV